MIPYSSFRASTGLGTQKGPLPCFGLHHPLLLFRTVDPLIFLPCFLLLQAHLPPPALLLMQAPEKQRRNKESCRNGSVTLQWAAAEGIGKYLGLTDSTGPAQAGTSCCRTPLQQPKQAHPVTQSPPTIVVNISTPTKTQETASPPSGEWGKGGNGCDEACGWGGAG